jgi:ArsR family transcriptional regulator, lead/cadmium/zinc/bismuth-responsive transcriptional repressor
MKCMSYEKFFEVFANETRLKIVESLVESNKNVSDICKSINEEQSKVSHNLKVLHDCNFITKERNGKHVFYSLNKTTIKPMLKIVDKHVHTFCKDNCVKKHENYIPR